MGSAHDKDLLYPRQREALECPVEQWGIAYRQQALAATNVKSHCGQKDVVPFNLLLVDRQSAA